MGQTLAQKQWCRWVRYSTILLLFVFGQWEGQLGGGLARLQQEGAQEGRGQASVPWLQSAATSHCGGRGTQKPTTCSGHGRGCHQRNPEGCECSPQGRVEGCQDPSGPSEGPATMAGLRAGFEKGICRREDEVPQRSNQTAPRPCGGSCSSEYNTWSSACCGGWPVAGRWQGGGPSGCRHGRELAGTHAGLYICGSGGSNKRIRWVAARRVEEDGQPSDGSSGQGTHCNGPERRGQPTWRRTSEHAQAAHLYGGSFAYQNSEGQRTGPWKQWTQGDVPFWMQAWPLQRGEPVDCHASCTIQGRVAGCFRPLPGLSFACTEPSPRLRLVSEHTTYKASEVSPDWHQRACEAKGPSCHGGVEPQAVACGQAHGRTHDGDKRCARPEAGWRPIKCPHRRRPRPPGCSDTFRIRVGSHGWLTLATGWPMLNLGCGSCAVGAMLLRGQMMLGDCISLSSILLETSLSSWIVRVWAQCPVSFGCKNMQFVVMFDLPAGFNWKECGYAWILAAVRNHWYLITSPVQSLDFVFICRGGLALFGRCQFLLGLACPQSFSGVLSLQSMGHFSAISFVHSMLQFLDELPKQMTELGDVLHRQILLSTVRLFRNSLSAIDMPADCLFIGYGDASFQCGLQKQRGGRTSLCGLVPTELLLKAN